MGADSEHWSEYYAVTVERPAWQTVRTAIGLFAGEADGPRFAVDLGCGAGRDTRELLRAGWQVLAIDREPAAKAAIERATEPELRAHLRILIEDLAVVAIPPCDLINASLSLPFLEPDAFDAVWGRIVAALAPGGRFAAMIFGDHDESATDPTMTCRPPDAIRASLPGFEIEYWSVEEDDRPTALGEPHHFHLIELVARKLY
jgi:tellurite methyltransferase